MNVPDETRLEWLRLLQTRPSIPEVADWCALKAAEIGWDFFDLSAALAQIQKPELPDPVSERQAN